jgi:hypothetical protein
VLAAVAGLVAWASVYHYYAARLALPLAILGLIAGATATRQRPARTLALLAAGGLSLTAAFLALAHDVSWSAFWPEYLGYVGNRGTPDVIGIAHEMIQALRSELPHALWLYFWRDRTLTAPADGLALGRPDVGGLGLLPVAALGIIGLVVAVRHPRRDLVWLALPALGLLVPCFSKSTARRFLAFDVGWCALAALGLVAILEAVRLGRAHRATLSTLLGLGLAVYAFVLLLVLDARIPPYYFSVIPFGESGFSDGMTCRACSRRAETWQREIASGAFVVLFDNDPYRENPTSPGGLPVYGKIAALAAGRPERFVEYYSLVTNADAQPPRAGPIHDPALDEVSYLTTRLDEARPDVIRWHFAQPTQWERWLADRLVEAGGELHVLDDPALALSSVTASDPALEVTTPAARSDSSTSCASSPGRAASSAASGSRSWVRCRSMACRSSSARCPPTSSRSPPGAGSRTARSASCSRIPSRSRPAGTGTSASSTSSPSTPDTSSGTSRSASRYSYSRRRRSRRRSASDVAPSCTAAGGSSTRSRAGSSPRIRRPGARRTGAGSA